LKFGPIDCPETSARDYHYILRDSPKERKYEVLISLRSVLVRIQISDLFLCHPKGTRSVNMLNILLLDKGVYYLRKMNLQ